MTKNIIAAIAVLTVVLISVSCAKRAPTAPAYPTQTSTATPTFTTTASPTVTPTVTMTGTDTVTPTITPTFTVTPTNTPAIFVLADYESGSLGAFVYESGMPPIKFGLKPGSGEQGVYYVAVTESVRMNGTDFFGIAPFGSGNKSMTTALVFDYKYSGQADAQWKVFISNYNGTLKINAPASLLINDDAWHTVNMQLSGFTGAGVTQVLSAAGIVVLGLQSPDASSPTTVVHMEAGFDNVKLVEERP